MLIAEHTVETTATAESIWACWADVASWPAWDDGVASSQLDGPFVAGTTGVLRPVGGPRVRFVLTEVEPLRHFADRSALPLARLLFSHSIEDAGGRRRLTHRVELHGPLTFLFRRVLAPKIAAGLPAAVAALARRAEAATVRAAG